MSFRNSSPNHVGSTLAQSWIRVFCLVCWVFAAATASAAPPFWGGLAPGAHRVGFRSFWSTDQGRSYASPEFGIPADQKHPRPVLVNLWYPAAAGAGAGMPHGDYLKIAPDDSRYATLASALAEYARDVISQETLRTALEDLDGAQRATFDALLATPTASVRDAAPAPGSFPLILYHAGYGSSFEDNAVLCEYLASHGYIVAGSAFLDGTGESFNIDAELDSEADLRHLIRVASELLPVDWSRIGMVGHSGGAHTAVRFMSRLGTPLDAVVLLDTTQDYHSFADTRWNDMVPLALDSADEITIPLLFAARQHALFRLGDSLLAAPRTYLTFRDLEHNSFISQGVIATDPASQPEAAAVRASYDELCRAVRLFLDAELGANPEARAALHSRWADAAPGESPVFAEFAAAGEGPPAYDESLGLPPTPRQMAALLDSGDAARVGELLMRFSDHPRARPLAETEFAISVMFQLVHEGREAEARGLLGHFPTTDAEILRVFGAMGNMYRRVGATHLAERFDRVVESLTHEQTP